MTDAPTYNQYRRRTAAIAAQARAASRSADATERLIQVVESRLAAMEERLTRLDPAPDESPAGKGESVRPI